MSDIAIHVEGIGKQYTIGTRQRYKTVRESIADAFGGARGSQRRSRADGGGSHGSTFWALRDVSFDLKRGEILGVVGRNGAGKSTLLKVLARVTKPTAGTVDVFGRIASLLEVGTGFHPELTGRENVYLNGAILGMHRTEIQAKFDEIISFAEVDQFIDTPVKHYSSGMYLRLAFSVAAHMEPEILLVDEVLAVGDAEFQKKCLGKMGDVAREGRTVLFVSHNLGAVSNLCGTGVVLDHGTVQYHGAVSTALDFYHRQSLVVNESADESLPHVLYQARPSDIDQSEILITSIQLLDSAGLPLPFARTWDEITIRITYASARRISSGAVEFELRTHEGTPVMRLSTRPDGTLSMALEQGTHSVDCRIHKLPLAAGEYVLGAGLAIPNIEWLWLRSDLARFTVVPYDVYGSGLAPSAARAIVAVEHEWCPA